MNKLYIAATVLAAASGTLQLGRFVVPLWDEPGWIAFGMVVMWRVLVLCALSIGLAVALPSNDPVWERRSRYALIGMLSATALGSAFTTPALSDPGTHGIWIALASMIVVVSGVPVEIQSRFVAATLGMAIYVMPLGLLGGLYLVTEAIVGRVAIVLGMQSLIVHDVMAWKRDRSVP